MARKCFNSCRSCQFHYKDKLNHERMCCVDTVVETKQHINQNGHIKVESVSVSGNAPCAIKANGAYACRKYRRNPRKPLQVRN